MKTEIDNLLIQSYQNTFFGINGQNIIKGMGYHPCMFLFRPVHIWGMALFLPRFKAAITLKMRIKFDKSTVRYIIIFIVTLYTE